MADRRTDVEAAHEASRAAARQQRDPRESVRRDDVEEVYGRPFSTFSIQHNTHVVPRDDVSHREPKLALRDYDQGGVLLQHRLT